MSSSEVDDLENQPKATPEQVRHKKLQINATPYMLALALSLHSFFEGIAIGIQTQPSVFYQIVVGIVIHKTAAAISLGVAAVKFFPTNFRKVMSVILPFSVATPLGMIVGIILSANSTPAMVNITFSSIAAGTFVYIACSEVIVQEFQTQKERYKKFLMFSSHI